MGKTVLIVDNQPVILEFLTNLLLKEGFTPLPATDGLSALALLNKKVPDVLITDLVMPNIDGQKLCKIVRNKPSCQNVYIIVLSAIAAEYEVNLNSIGANACIAKGPLNKMKDYILELLSRPVLDSQDFDQRNLFGLEDIFARKITRELLTSKRHFEVILDNMAEGILEVTIDGDIIYANPSVVEILGETEDELLGRNLNSLLFRINGVATKNLLGLLQEGRIRRDANIFHGGRQLSVVILPIPENHGGTAMVILEDVTERKRVEREMKRSLEEKEVLLKEVHHRVKNNLMMVAGLISLQAPYLRDERDVAILGQLKNRIQSISLVHEKLYLSHDLARVNFAAYVKDLSASVLDSLAADRAVLDVALSVADAQLSVDVAIPLGLIVAELITNALMHAFAPGAPGRISVSLVRQEDVFLLAVADNGRGLPPDFDLRASTTLGLQLVSSLALQLGGKLTFAQGDGTEVRVQFPANAESV